MLILSNCLVRIAATSSLMIWQTEQIKFVCEPRIGYCVLAEVASCQSQNSQSMPTVLDFLPSSFFQHLWGI